MTAEMFLRLGALTVVLLLAPGGRRRWMAFSGLLLGFACFGLTANLPSAAKAATQALAFTSVSAVAFGAAWPSIVARAAHSFLVLALPAAAWSALSLRQQPASAATVTWLVFLAALSVFAALAALANAEAGWRRAAYFAGAVLAPPVVCASLAALRLRAGGGRELALAAGAGLLGLLTWLPAVVAEWRRTARELSDEVRLGILPEEDALVLRSPWRRRFEKRFGRADERREYVGSALQLAVARQQQRRRTGQAVRLRQLEVLAFRTRIRTTS